VLDYIADDVGKGKQYYDGSYNINPFPAALLRGGNTCVHLTISGKINYFIDIIKQQWVLLLIVSVWLKPCALIKTDVS